MGKTLVLADVSHVQLIGGPLPLPLHHTASAIGVLLWVKLEARDSCDDDTVLLDTASPGLFYSPHRPAGGCACSAGLRYYSIWKSTWEHAPPTVSLLGAFAAAAAAARLSWGTITVAVSPHAEYIVGYAIHVGDDSPQHPRDWRLQGSWDGALYYDIDSRSDVSFHDASVLVFFFTRPEAASSARFLRLSVSSSKGNEGDRKRSTAALHLASFSLLCSKPSVAADYYAVAAADESVAAADESVAAAVAAESTSHSSAANSKSGPSTFVTKQQRAQQYPEGVLIEPPDEQQQQQQHRMLVNCTSCTTMSAWRLCLTGPAGQRRLRILSTDRISFDFVSKEPLFMCPGEWVHVALTIETTPTPVTSASVTSPSAPVVSPAVTTSTLKALSLRINGKATHLCRFSELLGLHPAGSNVCVKSASSQSLISHPSSSHSTVTSSSFLSAGAPAVSSSSSLLSVGGPSVSSSTILSVGGPSFRLPAAVLKRQLRKMHHRQRVHTQQQQQRSPLHCVSAAHQASSSLTSWESCRKRCCIGVSGESALQFDAPHFPGSALQSFQGEIANFRVIAQAAAPSTLTCAATEVGGAPSTSTWDRIVAAAVDAALLCGPPRPAGEVEVSPLRGSRSSSTSCSPEQSRATCEVEVQSRETAPEVAGHRRSRASPIRSLEHVLLWTHNISVDAGLIASVCSPLRTRWGALHAARGDNAHFNNACKCTSGHCTGAPLAADGVIADAKISKTTRSCSATICNSWQEPSSTSATGAPTKLPSTSTLFGCARRLGGRPGQPFVLVCHDSGSTVYVEDDAAVPVPAKIASSQQQQQQLMMTAAPTATTTTDTTGTDGYPTLPPHNASAAISANYAAARPTDEVYAYERAPHTQCVVTVTDSDISSDDELQLEEEWQRKYPSELVTLPPPMRYLTQVEVAPTQGHAVVAPQVEVAQGDDGPAQVEVGHVYRLRHWQHCDVFVYFSHARLTIPPPGWISAGHTHGVPVLGVFITEWADGEQANEALGLFPMETSAALAAIAAYHGFDGYLVNIESRVRPAASTSTSVESRPAASISTSEGGSPPAVAPTCDGMVTFLRSLTLAVHDVCGPQSLVLWYDSVKYATGDVAWQSALNEHNAPFLAACDGIFLDYHWSTESLKGTYAAAAATAAATAVAVEVASARGTFAAAASPTTSSTAANGSEVVSEPLTGTVEVEVGTSPNIISSNSVSASSGVEVEVDARRHVRDASEVEVEEARGGRVRDVFVGVDVWGRGCYGGGKWNCRSAIDAIRTAAAAPAAAPSIPSTCTNNSEQLRPPSTCSNSTGITPPLSVALFGTAWAHETGVEAQKKQAEEARQLQLQRGYSSTVTSTFDGNALRDAESKWWGGEPSPLILQPSAARSDTGNNSSGDAPAADGGGVVIISDFSVGVANADGRDGLPTSTPSFNDVATSTSSSGGLAPSTSTSSSDGTAVPPRVTSTWCGGWMAIQSGGDGWSVATRPSPPLLNSCVTETTPTAYNGNGQLLSGIQPDSLSSSSSTSSSVGCFVTSFQWCRAQQTVWIPTETLTSKLKLGSSSQHDGGGGAATAAATTVDESAASASLEVNVEVAVSEWYAGTGPNYSDEYYLCAWLVDGDGVPLDSHLRQLQLGEAAASAAVSKFKLNDNAAPAVAAPMQSVCHDGVTAIEHAPPSSVVAEPCTSTSSSSVPVAGPASSSSVVGLAAAAPTASPSPTLASVPPSLSSWTQRRSPAGAESPSKLKLAPATAAAAGVSAAHTGVLTCTAVWKRAGLTLRHNLKLGSDSKLKLDGDHDRGAEHWTGGVDSKLKLGVVVHHGGRDAEYWAGHFGAAMTGARVQVTFTTPVCRSSSRSSVNSSTGVVDVEALICAADRVSVGDGLGVVASHALLTRSSDLPPHLHTHGTDMHTRGTDVGDVGATATSASRESYSATVPVPAAAAELTPAAAAAAGEAAAAEAKAAAMRLVNYAATHGIRPVVGCLCRPFHTTFSDGVGSASTWDVDYPPKVVEATSTWVALDDVSPQPSFSGHHAAALLADASGDLLLAPPPPQLQVEQPPQSSVPLQCYSCCDFDRALLTPSFRNTTPTTPPTATAAPADFSSAATLGSLAATVIHPPPRVGDLTSTFRRRRGGASLALFGPLRLSRVHRTSTRANDRTSTCVDARQCSVYGGFATVRVFSLDIAWPTTTSNCATSTAGNVSHAPCMSVSVTTGSARCVCSTSTTEYCSGDTLSSSATSASWIVPVLLLSDGRTLAYSSSEMGIQSSSTLAPASDRRFHPLSVHTPSTTTFTFASPPSATVSGGAAELQIGSRVVELWFCLCAAVHEVEVGPQVDLPLLVDAAILVHELELRWSG